jgi:cyd operon protein YbgT
MWYFTWILGLGLAVLFGILNGIWYEFNLPEE